MEKIITLLTFSIFNSAFCICFAQAPAIQWQKALGGTNGDYAYSIQQTSDGGYIVAGYTDSNDGDVSGNHGNYDYWVVKLDTAGIIQWQKTLGGTNDDYANFIQQTSDGGYIVAGYSDSYSGDVSGNHGNFDYWVVKLDTAGTLQWQKSLGGTGDDVATSVQQTANGGYIVAGRSNSTDGDVSGFHGGNNDCWIVKLNTAGTLQWQKTLGGTGWDIAQSIQQTSDGGYIVAGNTGSNDGDVSGNHGGGDYWVVKLNAAGTIQWQKSLGGAGGDAAYSIQQTADGGYVVAGNTHSNDGDVSGNHDTTGTYADYWVVKLDATGTIQWQKTLGGTGDDIASSIRQTADGGYIVAGWTFSANGDISANHGYLDYWVVKLALAGTIQWQKSFGGTFGDEAYSIQQTADGGYCVAGGTGSLDGDVYGNHGNHDYWVVKLSYSVGINEISEENSFIIYPNPADGELRITSFYKLRMTELGIRNVKIYNLMGEEVVLSSKFVSSKLEISIDVSTLPKGIYFVEATTEKGIARKKFVKE